ncbi:pirin family protein [Kordia sp. YSTF-M3]|uniref:Pirin family protein n=1 Tax=Kordia aestuariivivens TaxID=2759037 RepID=A0ABR7Q7N1_9FLAO|nr:pirin family protein [Kordia aestuariivivens]MBC8754548.1 pirin family protein [Kordia aestuariivivens]
MKTIYHKANTRGKADHGWLKSHHSFSFASYQNPERMGFGQLRVLNDDIVKPKMGFGTHPHQNMEIISIPLSGALSHKDSMDNKRAITVGEVQVMSAGTGLQHSEFNDSRTDEVNFLQLWIQPETQNVTPRYEQKKFDEAKRHNNFQTVVSPQDNIIGDALGIHQQAYISLGNFDEGKTINFKLHDASHGIYIFLLEGEISVGNETLETRDAIGISDAGTVEIHINTTSKILVVEVPMN